jgi:hypothetical protein
VQPTQQLARHRLGPTMLTAWILLVNILMRYRMR